MNNERSFLKKYNIIPTGYEYKHNVKIIETKNNKYVLKRNKNNVLDIFNYLHLKNFNYFPNVYNKDRNDLYEIYEYIDSSDMSNYEKSEEIIYLLSLLHNKTTYYKNIDIDEYKIQDGYDVGVMSIDVPYTAKTSIFINKIRKLFIRLWQFLFI